MKINDQSNVGATPLPGAKSVGGVEPVERREVSHAVTSDGKDSAELSSLASKISDAVKKDSDNRAARVEELRAQVASGAYQVDAAATSHGIVNDAVAQAAAASGTSQT
jgi:flagellar biosynthesis anti-sigma factor FlgM